VAAARDRTGRALLVAAVVTAASCEPADDLRLPWWPRTRVAVPSPLLDAVGLAPPRLDAPGCHPGGSVERDGLRGVLLRLASGMEVTCIFPPPAPGGPRAGETDEFTTVTFDGRGRAETAARRSAALGARGAAALADSIVRRGLGLPGAQPLACPMEGWPYGVVRFDGVVPLVRGWRTPAYEALVLDYPAGPEPARGHVVHLRASRFGFGACRPRRAGRTGGHA
jgi:hypothetical protein